MKLCYMVNSFAESSLLDLAQNRLKKMEELANPYEPVGASVSRPRYQLYSGMSVDYQARNSVVQNVYHGSWKK